MFHDIFTCIIIHILLIASWDPAYSFMSFVVDILFVHLSFDMVAQDVLFMVR